MLRNAPELVFLAWTIQAPATTAGLVIAAGVVAMAAALAARKHANWLRSKLEEQSAAMTDTQARLQQATQQRDLAQQELNLQNDHIVQELRERSRRGACWPVWRKCCKVVLT